MSTAGVSGLLWKARTLAVPPPPCADAGAAKARTRAAARITPTRTRSLATTTTSCCNEELGHTPYFGPAPRPVAGSCEGSAATQGCAVACLAVGEVAGEADGGLGHDSALLDCLAGRSALPLDPGGRWMPCMLKDRQGQAVEPTKSARSGSGAAGRWSARVPAWLVGALAAGGRACQDRPARSLHPGCGGRARLSPRGPLGGLLQASPPGRVRPSGLWPADWQLRCGATCKPPAGPSLSALPGGRARLWRSSAGG